MDYTTMFMKGNKEHLLLQQEAEEAVGKVAIGDEALPTDDQILKNC